MKLLRKLQIANLKFQTNCKTEKPKEKTRGVCSAGVMGFVELSIHHSSLTSAPSPPGPPAPGGRFSDASRSCQIVEDLLDRRIDLIGRLVGVVRDFGPDSVDQVLAYVISLDQA